MKTKVTLWCDSCGTEIKFNHSAYENHIKKHHPKKVNVKSQYYKATMRREILNGN